MLKPPNQKMTPFTLPIRSALLRTIVLCVASLALTTSVLRAQTAGLTGPTPQRTNTTGSSLAESTDSKAELGPIILTQIFHIPLVPAVNYDPSPRDPFLDPRVTNTILEAQRETVIPNNAIPIETYFRELAELIANTNAIFGVSFSGAEPMVLFSTGVIGPEGGQFTLLMPKASTPEQKAKGQQNLTDRMLQSAQTFGLARLEQQLNAQSLPILLKRITPAALICRITGSNHPLIVPIKKLPNQVNFGFTNSLKP